MRSLLGLFIVCRFVTDRYAISGHSPESEPTYMGIRSAGYTHEGHKISIYPNIAKPFKVGKNYQTIASQGMSAYAIQTNIASAHNGSQYCLGQQRNECARLRLLLNCFGPFRCLQSSLEPPHPFISKYDALIFIDVVVSDLRCRERVLRVPWDAVRLLYRLHGCDPFGMADHILCDPYRGCSLFV